MVKYLGLNSENLSSAGTGADKNTQQEKMENKDLIDILRKIKNVLWWLCLAVLIAGST